MRLLCMCTMFFLLRSPFFLLLFNVFFCIHIHPTPQFSSLESLWCLLLDIFAYSYCIFSFAFACFSIQLGVAFSWCLVLLLLLSSHGVRQVGLTLHIYVLYLEQNMQWNARIGYIAIHRTNIWTIAWINSFHSAYFTCIILSYICVARHEYVYCVVCMSVFFWFSFYHFCYFISFCSHNDR